MSVSEKAWEEAAQNLPGSRWFHTEKPVDSYVATGWRKTKINGVWVRTVDYRSESTGENYGRTFEDFAANFSPLPPKQSVHPNCICKQPGCCGGCQV